ncbi:MAG TPA: AAA family ATPase [Gemmataceae bacterium]|nr:AAA family ATPase [Gemmataceae bacterium]
MPTGDSLDIVLKLLGYIAPVFGGLAIWAVTKYIRLLHVEKESEKLRKDKESVDAQLAEARQQHDATRLDLLERLDRNRAKYQEARDKFYRIRQAYFDLKNEQAQLSPATAESVSTGQLAQLEIERDQARQQVERLEQQIAEITRFDGRLWLRPPVGNVPTFRPLVERKAIIISVLNLKGGVGKTTVTANLAATLAKPKAPALVVDLDYQRSLSMLLVSNKDRVLLHRGGLTVQRFLGGTTHTRSDLVVKLKDLHPDIANCAVLTNSDARTGEQTVDSLEETENRLMVEWLTDRTRPDPRFFLREALHDPNLEFGYVLLDCPPRLTTACVNALVASDFVLIPVVPDPVSTRAVENLLRTLARFREELLPELAILGVVPNMVRLHKGEPVRVQADALVELKTAIGQVWDEPVPIFDTCIKHDSSFSESAAMMDVSGKLKLAVSDSEVGAAFDALARNLEKEIRRHASRRSATVPAKLGARVGSR